MGLVCGKEECPLFAPEYQSPIGPDDSTPEAENVELIIITGIWGMISRSRE